MTTGIMERQMYVPTETPEPSFMPNGTRNMLAMTWSNPAGFRRPSLKATACFQMLNEIAHTLHLLASSAAKE